MYLVLINRQNLFQYISIRIQHMSMRTHKYSMIKVNCLMILTSTLTSAHLKIQSISTQNSILLLRIQLKLNFARLIKTFRNRVGLHILLDRMKQLMFIRILLKKRNNPNLPTQFRQQFKICACV